MRRTQVTRSTSAETAVTSGGNINIFTAPGYPCERCGTPERRVDVTLPPVTATGRPIIVTHYGCPACEDLVPIIRRPNIVFPGMIYA